MDLKCLLYEFLMDHLDTAHRADGTLKWPLARVLSLVAGETGATDFALERPLAVGLEALECLLTLQLLQ